MEELTVDIEKTIKAPIERVFDAWLDPALLTRFMLPASGMENPRVTCDPRVDGRFEILMRVGDNEIPHTGSYLEIDRPNQLAFTWESPESPEGSVVTLTFSAIGEGQTAVRLRHVKFLDERRRDNHEGGWGNILATLDGVMRDASEAAA